MQRSALVAVPLALVATMLSVAAPASADQPVRTVFPTGIDEGPVVSVVNDLCFDPVTVTSTFRNVTVTEFSNRDGVVIRTSYKITEQDTFVGPDGATLTGLPYRFNTQFAVDDTGMVVRVVGTGVAVRVPLPDGSTFQAAGKINFLLHPFEDFVAVPDFGTPVNVDAFCEALGTTAPDSL